MFHEQLEIEFPSLAFPGRQVLGVAELAARLRVSDRHIIDLLDEGKIRGVNIGGPDAQRKHYRIPYEEYARFLYDNGLKNS